MNKTTHEYINVYVSIASHIPHKNTKHFRTLKSLDKAIKSNYVVVVCTFERLKKAYNTLYPEYLPQK